MAYDATKLKDWQIAEAAEENMPTPDDWREKLNLQKDEIIPFGNRHYPHTTWRGENDDYHGHIGRHGQAG
jgi:hypothetical protein